MPTDDEIMSVLHVWSNRRQAATDSIQEDTVHRAAIRQLRALFAQPEPKDAPRMSARLAIAMRVMARSAYKHDTKDLAEYALRCADALIAAADKETSK